MIWNILSVKAIKWNTLHSIKLCTLSSWQVIVLCFLGNILLGEHPEFSSTSTPHEWLVFSLWLWGIYQSQCRLFEVSASFSLALTQWTGNGSQKNKMGFPEVSAGRESACNARDTEDAGSIPGSGDPLEEEDGSPPQCSCLKTPWAVQQQESDTTERLTDTHTHTHAERQ